MADDITRSGVTRKFGKQEVGRGGVFAILLAVSFAATFFLLPLLQSLLLPSPPGGTVGPWIIRPPLSVHFVAAAVSAAVLAAVLLGPLKKRWRRLDEARGSRYDPFHGQNYRRITMFVKGGMLLILYLAGLVFYLLSWQKVDGTGVSVALPWGTRRHRFDQVRSLVDLPAGFRSDELKHDGPSYEVNFEDGTTFDFGSENEGLSPETMEAIAQFISDRSGQPWAVRADARPAS